MKIIKPFFVAITSLVSFLLWQGATALAQDITVTTTKPGSVNYLNFFAQVTPQGGPTVGQWFEVPYAGGPLQIQVQNTNAGSIKLSDVGFFISPTEIPLDNLNFSDEPPPGSPGSHYAPLPSLDATLSPGGSESSPTVTAPDQASTLALFSLAAVGLLVFRRTTQLKPAPVKVSAS